MSQQAEALKARTQKFAVDVCGLVKSLPRTEPGLTVQRQLTRAVTSVAANYRAACRARSHAEFTAKIGLVAEECDETVFWLEFGADASLFAGESFVAATEESRVLLAIFSKTAGTARRNHRIRNSR